MSFIIYNIKMLLTLGYVLAGVMLYDYLRVIIHARVSTSINLDI